MTDREKIVRGLENTRKLLSSFVFPFSDDADAVIADTISLLKEQETANLYKCPNCGTWVSAENVVRCKDCNKRYTVLCIQEEAGNINNQDDWFCADGVAKDINVPDKEGR